jgi:[ribosomal protein S5]-alanine N-acetyltransferase
LVLDYPFQREDEDVDAVLREIAGWLNDPAVVRFSEQRHGRHNLQTQREYINNILHSPNLYIGVYREGCLIGTMTVIVDTENSIANVGIMMGDKSKWGKGYGLEAWVGVCDELFKSGIRKIEAGCMAINYRMMAICQHYGMVEEGRQDKHFMLDGSSIDLVHWGKFNETS